MRTDEGGRYGYGEAVFIPRDGAEAEDDGWLMGASASTPLKHAS